MHQTLNDYRKEKEKKKMNVLKASNIFYKCIISTSSVSSTM